MDTVTTLIIQRPVLGIELLSMRNREWMDKRRVIFYPDGMDGKCSDFPYSGITVCCKWQMHFVLGCGHREKWVLSNTKAQEFELDCFGTEWAGCTATVCRM